MKQKRNRKQQQPAIITEQNALLWLDHDNAIAYRAILGKIYGVAAGVMLSQSLYWQRRVIKDSDRWWYKTDDEWADELGFSSRYAVRRARQTLIDAGVLEFKLEGMPRRAYYRINAHELAKQVAEYLNQCASVVQNRPSSCANSHSKSGEFAQQVGRIRTALINKDSETYTENHKDSGREGAACVNLRSAPSREDSWQAVGAVLSHINLESESCSPDLTAEIHAFRETYGFQPPTDALSLTMMRYCLQPNADEKVRKQYLTKLRQRAQEARV